ncbi:MAG: type II/IV secretion system protein [Deltaproteobacteria bacterium]|nr:type II/IV secretion system protein [Deltaproteobacteria bacterium]
MTASAPNSKSIHDESYLLDLLIKHGLLNKKQQEQIILKKNQQRRTLIRRQQALTAKDAKDPAVGYPDLIDIISSLHFELPGRPEQELTAELIMRHIAQDYNLPFKKLDPLELDLKTVTGTIPKIFALKHLLLPFEIKNGILAVAIYDPQNINVLGELERANQTKIQPYISPKADILKILAEFYGFQSSISAAEHDLKGPGGVDLGNLEQYVRISSSNDIASSDHHITSAVDHMFNYAFDQRASDIHIEPKREHCLIRIRIDGILHTIYKLPKVVHAAIISRVKSLSRLNIAEKRRPQDGRIKVEHNGKEAEIRVSTIPVAFGEKAVLRILDPDVLFQDLPHIGFSAHDLAVYEKFTHAPHGIILITGPTGSGKSTTLYSTLKNIASPEKNIVTVEDPIEMVHEEFNQIAVQTSAGVTFSSILKSILRQDPDIIMIGEIRDLDTARYAMQAALTGHLVFSTLHTNDAIAAIPRLIDLGVQPFMVASTMLGAMAQRLVRKVCPHCVEDVEVSGAHLAALGFAAPAAETFILKRGKGCQECRGTGYLGRCGIFEIFPMTGELRAMIAVSSQENLLRKNAIKNGMTTLREDAWRKVRNGVTTFEEAIRITGVS